MIAKVVDTNVLIVANDKSEQATLDCLAQCVIALDKARQNIIVIDDSFRIFKEYQNEVSPSGQPGVGDAFLRWLLQNWTNPAHCEAVTLKLNSRNSFDEFPNDPELADFDPSDHKFAAVANASLYSPDILSAVDSDWWIHGRLLERNGLKVVHLCEERVEHWEKTEIQK